MPPRFPLFIDLTNKPVAVVGGGQIGLRRAAVLRDFGAQVTLIAPILAHPLEGIVHIPRPYQPGDLEGALLVLADTDSRAVNDAVEAEARIAAERSEMLRQARGEVARLAVMAATEVAGKRLDTDSDRALAEEFLAKVGEEQ